MSKASLLFLNHVCWDTLTTNIFLSAIECLTVYAVLQMVLSEVSSILSRNFTCVCTIYSVHNLWYHVSLSQSPFKRNIKKLHTTPKLNSLLSPKVYVFDLQPRAVRWHKLYLISQQKACIPWKILTKGECCLEFLSFLRITALILEYSIRLIMSLNSSANLICIF